MRYCHRCGENYEEKDAKDHRVCKPRVDTSVDTAPKKTVSTQRKPKADAAAESLISAGTVERLPGRPKGKQTALADVASRPTKAEKVKEWRKANREKYNKRMREYRAEKNAGKRPLGIAYG